MGIRTFPSLSALFTSTAAVMANLALFVWAWLAAVCHSLDVATATRRAHQTQTLLSAHPTRRQRPSKFIIGGQPVWKDNQWPWQVRITYAENDGKTYLCGGTLIDKMHVLTAAHCVENMVLGSNTFVKLGLTKLNARNPNEEDRRIAKFIAHPRYNPANFHADIAILKLESAVHFTSAVRPVELSRNDTEILKSISSATVTGWGVYDPNFPNAASSELRETETPIISHLTCKETWLKQSGNKFDIDYGMLCAGAKGRGTGQGDSGGPLLAYYNGKYIQIGLTSFGENDAVGLYRQDKYPGVYTRVSYYYDFINCVINDLPACRAAQIEYLLPLLFAILYCFVAN